MRLRTRIFMVDDDPDLAGLLREGLKPYEQFELVGWATTAREALTKLQASEADVLLLDLRMPETSGLEALQSFKQLRPRMKIVVVTGLLPAEAELQTIRAGADGYVCKEGGFGAFFQELVQAVELTTRGKLFFDLAVWRTLFPLLQAAPPGDLPQAKLTARELEVLFLIVEGLTSRDIAARLEVSKKTIDKHRQHLMRKLQIRGTANLIKYALAAGLSAPRSTN